MESQTNDANHSGGDVYTRQQETSDMLDLLAKAAGRHVLLHFQ